ncbi:MAG: ABC transporter permease [Planctomycetota bacterium]
MLRLVLRNLLKHPLRSLLTVGSLVVALFLLCLLRSLVTALNAGVEAANAQRLIVQSAVSLFVDLPTSYQTKIEAVDGVASVAKWQWFGGYYQDPGNFFAQFAVDGAELFDMYPELEIVEGSQEGFLARRTSCVIGEGLVRDFGWKVGETIPIIGALFPGPGGEAWQFDVAAVYRPTRPNLDPRTLFFHWDYFAQTEREITGEEPKVGVFVTRLAPGADATAVMATVDSLFANGPQRVQTTTEAEFNRQFVSMVGNLPRFIGAIGGGVLLAILLACVNTMLMAGREQTHDVGILKALGFTNASVLRLLLVQSFVLCGVGGGLGILLAISSAAGIAATMGQYFPGYEVRTATILLAAAVTIGIGFLAGIFPAWQAGRRSPVEDLRATI